ncbi:MAG: glycoside hydrolase family 88 protein [Eubacteriales bacterium]|nr:glycoside hydrolase family 88 protein [Eubacteriales bacterium]
MSDTINYTDWAGEVLDKIRTKLEWVSEKNRHRIPYTTDESGSYDDRSDLTRRWGEADGLDWWTNGFWGGLMWLLYQDTKEEKYAQIARISEEKLSCCFDGFYGLHHDVGFMFLPTAVYDYRLTGREQSRRLGLHAANLLAGRFNPAGGFIRAWNDLPGEDSRGWAIIDCMLNIALLYWASEETKDPRFRQIAMRHADTVMEAFVRPDGSVCHIVEFDPETGERLKSHGGQGFCHGSAWTRGQGWALYGFMTSYRHTGREEYLQTAKRVAHYCMANLTPEGIIPVDFRQPKEPAWEDSCGAAVIAGGLLDLAAHVPEAEQDMYRRAAFRILDALYRTRCDFGPGCDAIVQNCSAAYHADRHHMTMVYADYFFAEALYRLRGGLTDCF